jgi:hypothetical protein
VSDTSAILNNATAKNLFESGMASQIATAAGVSSSAVAVTATAGSRRLALERELAAGTINVAYTITTVTSASSTVVSQIGTVNFKTQGNAVLTSMGSSASVNSATVTQAAAVPTPTTPTVPIDTSTAFQPFNTLTIAHTTVALAFVF